MSQGEFDPNKYQFFLAMDKIPTITSQQKKITMRNGKPSVYEPHDLQVARAMFVELLSDFGPTKPIEGPVRLITKWLFKRDIKKAQWKTTRPDTDNLIKLFKDCMTTTGYWLDDAQVCSEVTEKVIIPKDSIGGIYVLVEKLGDLDENL